MKTPYYLKFLFLTLLVSFALLGTTQQSFGQQVIYGNEWINYSQKYYKIKVPATGIYRLDKAYLQAAGINGVDPRKFQLYRRGQEVSIHVEGETDGSFDANDFIEFYGEQNDGAMDRELYKNPLHQLNPYYSLYTDTAAYFLTWSSAPGKRMVQYNQGATGLTPEPWHWQEKLLNDDYVYVPGNRYGESFMSWMDAGEGFTGSHTTSFTYNLSGMAPNLFSGGPAPKVEIAFVGANSKLHDIDVFVRPPSGPERLVGTVRMNNYEGLKQEFTLSTTDFFPDGKLVLRITDKSDSETDQSKRALFRTLYFKTSFPQRNIVENGGVFFKPAVAASTPLFYNFENIFAANTIGYDISSVQNIRRIPSIVQGTQKGIVFPPSYTKGILWTGTNLVPPPAKETVFRSVSGNKANFLIISHQSLMAPSGGSTNPVRDYAAYRASAVGGKYDTLTMEVHQIYDQFFYGDKSPAAIRRYMKLMLANGNPQYLFLIGKGIEGNIDVRKNPSRLVYKDLVPTGGTPGSDVFFTSDWELGDFVPKVATGRIPASTPQDVLSYLAKVRTHEALPYNLDWRKNILHLIGSKTADEQRIFTDYMKAYERTAEGPWLGGNVLTKIKSLTNVVETVNISQELNAGLSLITFFGHSSPTVSDLDIGLVSDVVNGYRNSGKYPMILMNGCNVGNTFTLGKSFGEDWLLTPDKGAISFLAHDSYGYPTLMNLFSSAYYSVAFGDSTYLTKSLGEQHKRTIELASKYSGDNATAMLMQMVLHADPALHLLAPKKADYAFSNGGATLQALDGTSVTANTEKFTLKLDIRNYGRVDLDTFYVSVNRKLPNGTEVLYDSIKVAPIYYRDTILVELDSKNLEGAGLNTFVINLDHTDSIDEINETNNQVTIEYFFSKDGVLALGPQEYSIVKDQKVKLIGQSTDLLTALRGYYFELDTVNTFNSAWKKTQVVRAASLPIWEVNLPANTTNRDSAVYYWRLRYETIASEEDTVWATSSFRYIPGSSPGWSQKALGQLQKANKQRLVDQPATNGFTFASGTSSKKIEINGVGGGQQFRYPPYGIFIDNFKVSESDCGAGPGMMAVVLNDLTLEPVNAPSEFGSICGTNPKIVYHFGDLRIATNQLRLENFLKGIPKGYHVAMVGMGNVPYSEMSSNLKAAFKTIGSSKIDQLQTGDPFAVIGKKGDAPGTATEIGATPSDPIFRDMQAVRIEKQVNSLESQGSLISTLIGPAKEWKSLHYKMKVEPSDSYTLDVIGVDANAKETMISSNVSSSNFSLAGIDAKAYPYLKLKLDLKDETQRTAPQLKEWTVLYEGVPEGLIRPDLVGVDKYLKLSEQASTGEVNLRFAFHNISQVNFSDSLTVEATVFAENGSNTPKTFKVEALQKEDTVFFNHKFSTVNLRGANRLRVTVNPRILPEQTYLNNTLELPFNVTIAAGMPPVVDVVFDGVRILDGDIVSPSPLISMVLKNNNKLVPITDPASMKVYLKKSGAEFKEIDVTTDPKIKWFPADDKNDFRVEYLPEKMENGKYTLEVQGVDALGQRAGSERYSINFEVVNEASITNFYPYPNPFSSKTRFVFTLTGSTVPEKMKLQIMTVTGKVIREVQKEELGPIRIGNNVSEFAWDGTDEFGDRLANGVYLYRVVMDNGPEEMKHRFTAGDKAFKNGYGKIYILR